MRWRLGIAAVSLSAAVAVYCLARYYPPALLEPLRATQSILAARPELFGSLPSLFYMLAMGLLVGSCAATPGGARLHCALWIGIGLVLELTQHPLVAAPLSSWIPAILGDSVWTLIGPYWLHGTFDPADLLATVVGGASALAILAYTQGNKHEAIS
ncbi:MAG: hypothetical protein LJE92_02990 [Gammaproteobacteria bacterium]|nr:hypothetical protein [Gammaproteobacteria bacterium]